MEAYLSITGLREYSSYDAVTLELLIRYELVLYSNLFSKVEAIF